MLHAQLDTPRSSIGSSSSTRVLTCLLARFLARGRFIGAYAGPNDIHHAKVLSVSNVFTSTSASSRRGNKPSCSSSRGIWVRMLLRNRPQYSIQAVVEHPKHIDLLTYRHVSQPVPSCSNCSSAHVRVTASQVQW